MEGFLNCVAIASDRNLTRFFLSILFSFLSSRCRNCRHLNQLMKHCLRISSHALMQGMNTVRARKADPSEHTQINKPIFKGKIIRQLFQAFNNNNNNTLSLTSYYYYLFIYAITIGKLTISEIQRKCHNSMISYQIKFRMRAYRVQKEEIILGLNCNNREG